MVPPKVTDDPRELKVMVDHLSAQLRDIFAKLPADHPQRADLRANMDAIQEASEQLLPAYESFLSEEAALAKRVEEMRAVAPPKPPAPPEPDKELGPRLGREILQHHGFHDGAPNDDALGDAFAITSDPSTADEGVVGDGSGSIAHMWSESEATEHGQTSSLPTSPAPPAQPGRSTLKPRPSKPLSNKSRRDTKPKGTESKSDESIGKHLNDE